MGMTDRIHIGCGAGFSGDRVDAPIAVVRALAEADAPAFLFFETLGERTLALAQLARQRDPERGFEPLLDQLLRPVLADCLIAGIRIVGNFGAANPRAAANAIKALALEIGCREPRIAVVIGDDLSEALPRLDLQKWEGEPESRHIDRTNIIAANAYLGAEGIAEGLDQGADIVVTGRVSDPSLVLGPLRHAFGWAADDWDRIAAGIVAGHLLECGSQVSGGYFADPGRKDVSGLDDTGYPIGVLDHDGGIEITKPAGTGGTVTLQTVKEQLLYEIHDPAAYLTPDGTADFTGITLDQAGPDRVRVNGVRGAPATDTYKATLCTRGGWLGEAEISYAGPGAEARARLTADILMARLKRRGLDLRTRIDLIGVVSVLGDDDGTLRDRSVGNAEDVRVRLAVEAEERAEAEAATQEVLALLCAGPAGGGGLRRWHVERIHTVSALVPKADVPVTVEIV